MPDFFSNVRGMMLENKFNRILIALLVALNLILATALSNKKPIVVLTPPEMNKEATISVNAASAPFKQAWGMFLASLVGNVTPGNVDFVQRTLERMLDARLYQAVQEGLEMQAQQILDANLSVSFMVDSVLYEPALDKVFVTGTTTTKGPYGDPAREKKTYEIEVSIRNYRPVFTYLDSYVGGPKIKEALKEAAMQEG